MEGTGFVGLRHSRPWRTTPTFVGVGVYNRRAVLYCMRLRVEASSEAKASRRRSRSASSAAISALRAADSRSSSDGGDGCLEGRRVGMLGLRRPLRFGGAGSGSCFRGERPVARRKRLATFETTDFLCLRVGWGGSGGGAGGGCWTMERGAGAAARWKRSWRRSL